MYKVAVYFNDLQDGNRAYNVGDVFPHDGVEVSAERLAELAGPNNKRGIPLIERVTEEAKKPAKKAAAKKK